MSVCEITRPQTYSASGEPVAGGLDDPRMGDTSLGNEEHPVTVVLLNAFNFDVYYAIQKGKIGRASCRERV